MLHMIGTRAEVVLTNNGFYNYWQHPAQYRVCCNKEFVYTYMQCLHAPDAAMRM